MRWRMPKRDGAAVRLKSSGLVVDEDEYGGPLQLPHALA